MAIIKYKDANGTLTPLSAGLHTHAEATAEQAGFMSAEDKEKLDSLDGTGKIVIDDAMSDTSANPVQNKVVNKAISTVDAKVGEKAVSEQIGVHAGTMAKAPADGEAGQAGHMSAVDKEKLNGIDIGANNYTHPTTAGNKHIPAGGSSGQILRWSEAGTAVWSNEVDTNTDTKNTAGSTNTSNKIYLVGATSQAANPQTYSHDTAYVGADGCLYSDGTKVSVEGHSHAADINLSTTSTNAVQNKAVTTAINNIEGLHKTQNGSRMSVASEISDAIGNLSPFAIGAAAENHGVHLPDGGEGNGYFLRWVKNVGDNTYMPVWSPYSLPTASTEYKGMVQVGNGLTIDTNGILSTAYTIQVLNSEPSAGTADNVITLVKRG